MTTQKTIIQVEIIHKQPLKKTLNLDLPGRLARCAYDTILARGGDCEDVTAKIVKSDDKGEE